LIRALRQDGHRLTIASSGPALDFLQVACPDITYVTLPSYGVRYPFKSMFWSMGWQGPRILHTAWRENQQVKALVEEEKIDLLISDGRFGCFHPDLHNIWLAHQLQIQLDHPAMADQLNGAYHAHLRRHFQEIWVPDWEGENRLAGNLSAPVPGIPHRYLGALTRYLPRQEPAAFRYLWLALLSGPEPQRSKLEEALFEEFKKQDQPCLLVRGLSGSDCIQEKEPGLFVADWLHDEDLEMAVTQSRFLVCRSGYSTLLDLSAWRKPALLIPTPGQTEQVYLAHYWQEKSWAFFQEQDELDLVSGEKILRSTPWVRDYPTATPLQLKLPPPGKGAVDELV
jgi:hypothetical protein